MNLKRVGNLLGFEWKRIKWLVVAAWVFLAMAFVPRLSEALGIWNHDWSDAEDFLTGVGGVGFGLAGLFLAIWSGLVGRKFYPVRPIMAGEVRVVSLGILLGVLVVPVVLLTLVSLWLYGFSGKVIWRNVGMTILAVLPLWLGVRLFARYAGSFKTMVVGLVMMAGLMAFGDSLRLKGVMEPWVNGMGTSLSAEVVGVTWVFLLLLLCGWPLVRNRAAGLRVGVAVGLVVVSWLAVDRIAKREELRSQVVGAMESKIEWRGEHRISSVGNGLQFDTFYKAWSDDGERLTQWMMVDDFRDEEGRVLRAPKSDSYKWINRENKTRALRRRIPEGKLFYEDGVNDPAMIDGDLEAKRWGSVRGYVDGGALGESRGRLQGAVMELDKLVEVPLGGEGTFQRDGMIGSVRWGYYRLDEWERPLIRVKDATMNYWERGRDESAIKDLVFMISYPRSGFVVEGQIGGTDRSPGMVGGLREWSGWVRYRTNVEMQPGFVEGESPVLTVWRLRVVEEGWCEATIPAVGVGLEPRTNYDFLALVSQGSVGRGREPNVSERPDPESATRGEVGGWLRKVGAMWKMGALWNYEPRLGEFGEYGERFGDVLIGLGASRERFHKWNVKKTFLESSDHQWREELVDSLGKVEWAPEVLVKKGWAESARGMVEELLAGGTKSEGVLKLGIYLAAEGIEEALVEAMGQSQSSDLYEVARTLPKFEERREEVLDERRAILERRMKARWSDYRDREYLRMDGWGWLLSQGRIDDLEGFLFWVRRYYGNSERRNSLPDEYAGVMKLPAEGSVIARAKKWEVEFFRWEPVLQEWVFNEKEKVK
jgi:hypothetical protein